MSLKNFFELVEIKAKTASVLPYIIGVCYSWYHYQSLHLGYLMLFFIAMFIFNMAVDILDNYNDYHHANLEHDYREKTNIIGRENLSLSLVRSLIVGMILFSAALGIFLSVKTGWPLLWMGIYCYAVGIFYSSGPKPLSSLPLGELFSGLTMGFVIVLISVYVNTFEQFEWNFVSVGGVFLVSLPNVLLIANLMLANNTCDLDEDEKNHRYTLVHYLGKKNAVHLFVFSESVAFLAIILAIILKLTPIWMLGTFLTLPLVIKQSRLYLARQVKKETFSCAIKILAVVSFAQVLFFAIGLFL